MSNSTPIAEPMAMTRARISAFASILSSRARSTFNILPRNGRMACVRRSRADLLEPPAESPSTIKSSDSSGCFEMQSASLPGRASPSSAPFRSTVSLAALAAWRALAASRTFSIMRRPSCGRFSRNSFRASLTTLSTAVRASGLPSLALVWPSNWGSGSLTEMTAMSPSRVSSLVRLSSFSFR